MISNAEKKLLPEYSLDHHRIRLSDQWFITWGQINVLLGA